MKTTVSVYDFRDAFKRMGRENQFSYDGLTVLFDYFEEIEESCGEESELDVIGVCCEFAEGTPEEIAADYSIDCEGDEEEIKAAVLDYLADEGVLIGETDNSIVYRQF
jgi:hypothetical protein